MFHSRLSERHRLKAYYGSNRSAADFSLLQQSEPSVSNQGIGKTTTNVSHLENAARPKARGHSCTDFSQPNVNSTGRGDAVHHPNARPRASSPSTSDDMKSIDAREIGPNSAQPGASPMVATTTTVRNRDGNADDDTDVTANADPLAWTRLPQYQLEDGWNRMSLREYRKVLPHLDIIPFLETNEQYIVPPAEDPVWKWEDDEAGRLYYDPNCDHSKRHPRPNPLMDDPDADLDQSVEL
ncbi:MAG: hypothetical protein M1816_004816 [Peltula sp. TS41687]|nr:MAG: hypothetical protein M1816_004816 [Peltula sp. TS41687]